MKEREALKLALEAAYLAGFNASGEGYNGEYPFGDKMQDPAENRVWKKNRDNYIKEALAQPEQEPVNEWWKLVPVKPTEDMWKAVNKLDDEMAAGNYDGKGCSIEQAWNCLLDAAPTPPQRKPLTDEQERKAFEDYAVRTICNPVELQYGRLGGYTSQELNYLWRGWKARAAHGIKE